MTSPIRPVSEDHCHADYAPRSQVIAALRKAKAPDELIAWAANVLPDAEAHLRTPAGDTEAMRLLMEAREHVAELHGEHQAYGYCKSAERTSDLLTRIDALCVMSDIAVLAPPLQRVERLEGALEDAAVWHDAQAKALSKQPQSGDTGWRRMEHREQADNLRAALGDDVG